MLRYLTNCNSLGDSADVSIVAVPTWRNDGWFEVMDGQISCKLLSFFSLPRAREYLKVISFFILCDDSSCSTLYSFIYLFLFFRCKKQLFPIIYRPLVASLLFFLDQVFRFLRSIILNQLEGVSHQKKEKKSILK